MHRNTFVLTIILTIAAAVIVAINLVNLIRGNPNTIVVGIPTPALSPTPSTEQFKQFTSAACEVSMFYPGNYQVTEEGNSARLIKDDSSDVIVLTCQKEIPRPPLAPERIEKITIGTVSAILYHDGSGKDGTPIDRLIFTHPGNGLDVYLAGIGENFNFIRERLYIAK